MRVLLAAVNSKYIHSNLAVYSLKAYHDMHTNGCCDIEIAEYTINQPIDDYISDIYMKNPDVIAFSCYIWNIKYIYETIIELKKILPSVKIWLGGPEVSFDAVTILQSHIEVDGVMCGEGEVTFCKMCNIGFDTSICIDDINGICYRDEKGIKLTAPVEPMKMDELPFVYNDLDKFKNKIIYYESSRGCPFGCSYCLSSVDKKVRFRSLFLVFCELKFFLDNEIAQVKFVDRTFNCNHDRTKKLLTFIKENDNGITNFHFEIAADLLNDEEIEILSKLRPGLVQLEIGVQSTNVRTIEDINRVCDYEHLSKVVKKLNMGKNVHLHLDLIAGLPDENIESFHRSFNDVFGLKPEQLQLGFLKVLKGSPMHMKVKEYGIVYKSTPPYEVLKTKWISYEDILHLKKIEDMVEVYYNSGQYSNTINALVKINGDAYAVFESVALFYDSNNYFGIKHSRISRYEILYKYIMQSNLSETNKEILKELLIFDLYLRENLKSRPFFAHNEDKDLLHKLYNASKASKTSHLEKFSKGILLWIDVADSVKLDEKVDIANIETADYLDKFVWLRFDYDKRNPLNYNCNVCRLIVKDVR